MENYRHGAKVSKNYEKNNKHWGKTAKTEQNWAKPKEKQWKQRTKLSENKQDTAKISKAWAPGNSYLCLRVTPLELAKPGQTVVNQSKPRKSKKQVTFYFFFEGGLEFVHFLLFFLNFLFCFRVVSRGLYLHLISTVRNLSILTRV